MAIKIEAAERLQASDYPKYAVHSGRILLLGFGGVGQTMLPMVLRHIKCNPSQITVIEKDDHSHLFGAKYGATGVEYKLIEVVRENFQEVMSSHVGAGDLVINLSLNIDGIEIVTWCLENQVMYIDTSIERWPDEPDETLPELADRTLYHTHQKMREAVAKYPEGSTCVVTHGANPGLVSHFTKAALLDIVKALGHEIQAPNTRGGWAALSRALGVKVIHIAERDTQTIDKPKQVAEFVNTWSCEGFWAEGRAPAEMGWGTHETKMPYNGHDHKEGPQNAIYLSQPSVSVLLKSWVPKGGAYNGFCVQHSEAVTISEYLSTSDYRPSVYYVYCPCDAAVVSVHEFRGRELDIQATTRIAKTEIVDGIDELGVLLMGHKLNAWFYGSQLGIEEARRLLPGEGPTTIQVGASIIGALVWMLNNPHQGYCEPEDLPHEEILKYARPYLGPMVSGKSDWTPQQDRNTLFPNEIDPEHPWAFENFQISS